MIKAFIMLTIFFIAATNLLAQKKLSFSSQNYVGLVAGEVNSELQLQTINGIKKGPWFAGIGAGIDWYYLRSIPLFVSVNRNIFSKGKRFMFVSGDAGKNFSWRNNVPDDFPPYDRQQTNGLYWAAGAGYKFGIGKSDNSILMQFGYSYKKMGEETKNVSPCFFPPCPESVTAYDYQLKRLSFKIGWGF
jgi:hypothetical protein